MTAQAFATAASVSSERSATTDELDATYIQSAIESARAKVNPPPGSGRLRGVWYYGGNAYAFRDDATASQCRMYVSAGTGWDLVDLGHTIGFEGGTREIADGTTIHGAASGASATVSRVVLRSGDWTTGDATGILCLTAITGNFIPDESLTASGGGFSAGFSSGFETETFATSTDRQQAVQLRPGGRCEFVNHNFGGHSGTERMYGADGVSSAFEFDGTVFVPIATGMATDTPSHIAAHKNQLILTFEGGSLQHSGVGNPYAWTILAGAAEIGFGEEIVGILSLRGVLAIFGRNRLGLLYGNSSDDWALDILSEEAGAIEWTIQDIATAVYLDDRGIRALDATQAFGDFRMNTLSRDVEPIFRTKRAAGVTPVASIKVREKDQYRLFWSDGTGLTMYLGRKKPEILTFDLGMAVHAICTAEDADGNEVILFGSADGYVYQLDAGTSLDGSAVGAFVRLAFNHVGSPSYDKRWHKVGIEMTADDNTTLAVVNEFAYAAAEQPPSVEQSIEVPGAGGFWDEDNFDQFNWSSPINGTAETFIDGIGKNISIAIVSSATYEAAHTLHGVTLHYSERRMLR